MYKSITHAKHTRISVLTSYMSKFTVHALTLCGDKDKNPQIHGVYIYYTKGEINSICHGWKANGRDITNGGYAYTLWWEYAFNRELWNYLLDYARLAVLITHGIQYRQTWYDIA